MSNPTRPMSINKIRSILPISVKLGVNPIVNPTVPKQEKTSIIMEYKPVEGFVVVIPEEIPNDMPDM